MLSRFEDLERKKRVGRRDVHDVGKFEEGAGWFLLGCGRKGSGRAAVGSRPSESPVGLGGPSEFVARVNVVGRCDLSRENPPGEV